MGGSRVSKGGAKLYVYLAGAKKSSNCMVDTISTLYLGRSRYPSGKVCKFSFLIYIKFGNNNSH